METTISVQLSDSIAETARELSLGHIRREMRTFAALETKEKEEGGVLYLPLEPAGYPISPDDLDFGSGNPTATQIKNASQFSQLMNQIPNPGQKVWIASGEVVWNIWDMVLDSMQLPAGGPTRTLQELKTNFELEKRSDMKGDTYYQTDYSPDGFWKSIFDSQWKSYAFSPQATSTKEVMSVRTATGCVSDLEFDTTGMSFTAEIILVTLMRPWWSPWLFSSTTWRYSPGSLAAPLSDGLTPPQGVMTMYPNAFLVARNVHLGLDMSRLKNASLPTQIEQAQALSWSAFQMKGANQSTSMVGCEANLKLSSDGLDSSGLQILGFSCNKLPKCPNPDLSQKWP